MSVCLRSQRAEVLFYTPHTGMSDNLTGSLCQCVLDGREVTSYAIHLTQVCLTDSLCQCVLDPRELTSYAIHLTQVCLTESLCLRSWRAGGWGGGGRRASVILTTYQIEI